MHVIRSEEKQFIQFMLFILITNPSAFGEKNPIYICGAIFQH